MTAGVAYSISGRPWDRARYRNRLLLGPIQGRVPRGPADGLYHRGLCELDEDLEASQVGRRAYARHVHTRNHRPWYAE